MFVDKTTVNLFQPKEAICSKTDNNAKLKKMSMTHSYILLQFLLKYMKEAECLTQIKHMRLTFFYEQIEKENGSTKCNQLVV